jgi:glyoxylase-like metal-dependent hydrolase (beta-lactamase superfamily II)
VYRFEASDGPRIVCQAAVVGTERTVIVDSGLPETPARLLVPFVQTVAAPREITLILTHPDSDHVGGTAGFSAACPKLEVAAHEADRALLGSAQRTIQGRYQAFAASDGIVFTDAARARATARLGGPFTVSRWLTGDVELFLGGVACRLVHLPGHSAGHMGVWLPESRTLIGGDAVMGRGIPKCDGELLYGPQFLDPGTYLATIDRIESLAPELLLLAHEQPLSGEAVGAFLEASRAAVHLIEQLTLDAVADRAATLMEACSYVHERYGGLPEGGAADIAPSVAGILVRQERAGNVVYDQSGSPRRFRAR